MKRLATAIEAVKLAGERLLTRQPGQVRRKNSKDIVTEADIEAQNIITDLIKSRFPNDCVLSEESDTNSFSLEQDTWVIDPLDGTVNYASSFPFWSVSVAFLRQGKPSCGAVYIPVFDELYWAEAGKPSFCNGNLIKPSDKQHISDALVSIVLPSRFDAEQTRAVFEHAARIGSLARGIRIVVSEAAELCFVASGKLDGNYCPSKGFFSAAAASLIAKQAGCIVTDTSGNDFIPGTSRNIVAGNPFIHRQLLHYFTNNHRR